MNPFIRLFATITFSLLAANIAFGQEAPFEIPNPFADLPATPEANADVTGINGDVDDTVRPAKRQGERIELLDDFEQATKLSLLEQRPVLAVLGAEWCIWCRKLEGELETKDADPILKRWIVVKVDVDNSPDLADKLRANALPSLRILGRDQKIIAASEGYVPLAELAAWLNEHLAAADPAIQRVLYATGSLASSDLKQLGGFLADSAVDVRIAAQERLFSSRPVTMGFVVDLLRTGNLSQQLSAVGLLRRWNAPIEGVDPWEPDSINAESVAPLLDWLADRNAEAAESAEMPKSDPTPLGAAEVSRRIRDILIADPTNRQAAKVADEVPDKVADEVAETEAEQIALAEDNELDMASSFFGDLPSGDARDESDPPAAKNAAKQKPSSLPSAWLTRWQALDETQAKKVSWVDECKSLIEKRLQEQPALEGPDGVVEEHWLQLGLLACGDKDIIAQLLASERNADKDLEVQAIDLAAWLPEEERLQFVQSQAIDFAKLSSDSLAVLDAALEIDSLELGNWIVERHDQLDAEQIDTSRLTTWLLKALLGSLYSGIDHTFAADDLASSKEAFVDFIASRHWPTQDASRDTRLDSIAWLERQYRQSVQPKVKAAILAALSYFDHKLATQCSVGLIMEAREYNASVEAALLISLSDQESLSCDRAVLFLDHELAEVRLQAAKRFSKTSWDYSSGFENITAMRFYDYSTHFPGIWHVRRTLPVEALRTDNATWESKVLLLAVGQATDLSEALPLNELSAEHVDDASRVFIVAALSHANRTDEEAISYYEKEAKGLQEPAVIYAMLRTLKGDEVSQIRSAMRKEYGSSVLIEN